MMQHNSMPLHGQHSTTGEEPNQQDKAGRHLNLDAILTQVPDDSGISGGNIVRMLIELGAPIEEDLEFLRIEGDSAIAFGFMRDDAANSIDYLTGSGTLFSNGVADILNDMELETADELYTIEGLKVKIMYPLTTL